MNIVIVGGGFAGVRTALMLDRYNIGPVTLISDEPYFLHHATLYSTATGKSPSESVIQLSEIFAGSKNVRVVHDKIVNIDTARKLAVGSAGHYKYDSLVIAIGSVTTYFGIKGMSEHAFGIKSLNEVEAFTKHIEDEIITHQHLDKHYYVIGGGPTGVELAGALQQYLEHLKRMHKNTKGRISVVLVEAADRLVPRMSKTASAHIQKRLERLGVRVLLSHKVQELSSEYIVVDGRKVHTETAIWTSGVANNPFFTNHHDIFDLAPNGRVNTDEYLQAANDIYVLGDNNTAQHSGQAWPALWQGEFIARHLRRKIRGMRPVKFRSKPPMCSVPVGEGWGYNEWHGVYVQGRSGYALRRLVELLGYRKILLFPQAKAAWMAHKLPKFTKM